jgi:hypothetical protein
MGVTDPGVIGLAAAVSSAAVVAGAVTFAKSGRSPHSWLPVVFGLCAPGFVIWIAPDPLVLTAGAVINCLGGGIMLPSLLTLAMSRLDHADRGRGTGLWTGAFFIGQFICPLVALALASAVGGPTNAMGVLAAVGAAGSTGLALSAHRGRRPRSAPATVAPPTVSTVVKGVRLRPSTASPDTAAPDKPRRIPRLSYGWPAITEPSFTRVAGRTGPRQHSRRAAALALPPLSYALAAPAAAAVGVRGTFIDAGVIGSRGA